ncbi:MAG: type II secretion system F family protein [Desulfobacteraceae bacterium]|nr:MAG: type II secretion system F family protein [Desulfobacteraceae bacterium]
MSGFITSTPFLFSVITFIVFCLFFLGIFQILQARSRKEKVKAKIRQEQGPSSLRSITGEPKEQSAFLHLFHSIGQRTTPKPSKNGSQARIKYIRADFRHPHAPTIFWGSKIFLMLLFALCFLVLYFVLFKTIPIQVTMLLGILIIAMGFYLPDIWLALKTSARKRRIFEGFPDALDLLCVCVEAGMGLDAAIARVGEEIRLSSKVLSNELKLVNMEIRAGKTREEALRNLALRADLEDVRGLATLLIQTDRFGTSIAQTLRVYADTFRSKRFQRAEEIAAKLPVKLTFPLIFFILPSLFVVIAGPIVIRFIKVFFTTFGK